MASVVVLSSFVRPKVCVFSCQFLESPGCLVRLGCCLTPYQRPRLYNGAPLVAFYDTLGIRRTYSRLKPPASPRGPGCLGRISTGVTVTFSMEWLYVMKWSYKKFLYLRLELFRILNEWLRKRPFRLWDDSPTYWAPQPLASHVIKYIKFELFQSTSLSIWMPYLLPLG